MSKNKLIDCFPYYRESILLEFRIRLLYDHVDKFLISEGNKTFSGINKTYNCRKHLESIDDPLNKIVLVELDFNQFPECDTFSGRENLQRDVPSKLLDNFDDDCIFYFSDCDEILNPDHLEWVTNVVKENPDKTIRTPLAFLNCKANLRVYDNERNVYVPWAAPFMATKKHLEVYTPSEIREIFAYNSPNRVNKFSDVLIQVDGKEVELGWHFSWTGENMDRFIKYKSYSHANDFDQKFVKEYLMDYDPNEDSFDPLGRKDHILKKYDISNLPSLIFEEEKFKNYFLPGVDIKKEKKISNLNGLNIVNLNIK
jgi:hypothetical protein